MLAVLAGTKVVHWAWNHERAARTISGWASDGVGGRGGPARQALTIRRVEYRWIPALRSLFWGPPVRFDAWGFGIWDPDGNEVIHAAHFEAGLRLDRLVWAHLRSLVSGPRSNIQLHFVDAIVDDLGCRIVPTRHGAVNLVAAFAPTRPKLYPGGIVVSLERATVIDGSFLLDFPGWHGEIEHLKLQQRRLRYSSFAGEQALHHPALAYEIDRLEAPSGRIVAADLLFPLDHIVIADLHATAPRSQDMILQAVARSLGADITADGQLSDVYAPVPGIDLQLGLRHGHGLLSGLPSKRYLGGDPSGSAHIRGPFGDLVVDGAFRGFEVHAGGFDFHHVSARYRLEHAVLHIRDSDAEFAGGHLLGDGAVELAARRWNADLHVTGIHLTQLKQYLPIMVFSELATLFPRMINAARGGKEIVGHLHIGGVELTLRQRPKDALPTHILLRGRY